MAPGTKSDFRIFIPRYFPQLTPKPQLLWGWYFTNSRTSSHHTLVVLGTIEPQSRAEAEAYLSHISCLTFFETLVRNFGGKLGIFGTLGKGVEQEATGDLWPVWDIPETGRRNSDPILRSLKSSSDYGRFDDIQVFMYDPSEYGKAHMYSPYDCQLSSDATPLEIACWLINTGPALQDLLDQHLGKCDAGHSIGQSRWAVPVLVSQSLEGSPKVLTETGRFIQSLGLIKCTENGEGVTSMSQGNALYVQRWHASVTCLLQVLLGVGFAVWLMQLCDSSSALMSGVIKDMETFMDTHLVWLSGAPAGIKLHKQLAELYAEIASRITEVSLKGYMCISPYTPHCVTMLACVAAVGGASLALVLCCDLLYVLALPLTVLYTGASAVYSVQLYLLNVTWMLLRGKHKHKRRRLRRGSGKRESKDPRQAMLGPDKKEKASPVYYGTCNYCGKFEYLVNCKIKDDEVLMEHLIVGVLLFTPLLALMPTTIVFYTFFLCIHGMLQIVRVSLATASDFLSVNPLLHILLRTLLLRLTPGGIFVKGIDRSTATVHSSSDDDGSGLAGSETMESRVLYYKIGSTPCGWKSAVSPHLQFVFRRLRALGLSDIAGVLKGKVLGMLP